MSVVISRRTLLGLTALSAYGLSAENLAASAAQDAPVITKPVRFAVYGDTRDGHDMHRKLVALIIKQEPSLVFQTGDLVHNAYDDHLWKIYDEIVGEMRKKIPLYPARGNHDFGGHGYADRVTSPFTSGNKDYYSFSRGNCHFIVLDIDEHARFGPTTAQYKWFLTDLKAANGKAKHIFVFFHVSPYSIGSHGMNLEVQEVLCPLFVKYGVRIVFTGHDHNYYHTSRDGITYVVTGGGGAPLYDGDASKGAIPGDKFEKVNHFCGVVVDGDNVTVEAIRVDGTLIERFTVTTK